MQQKLPFSAVLAGDSCDDPAKLFVFFGSVSNEAGISIKTVGPAGAEECNQRCVAPAAALARVADCQVHFFPVANGVSPDLAGAADLFCLACRPGFRAAEFHPSNFTISKCEAVPGCDASSAEQTWMNQCRQCQPGKAWGWDPGAFAVDFSQCTDLASRFSGCAVLGPEGCVACDAGLVLTADLRCSTQSDCAPLGNGGFGFLRATELAQSLAIRAQVGRRLTQASGALPSSTDQAALLLSRMDVLSEAQFLLLSSFMSSRLSPSFAPVGCAACGAGRSLFSLENAFVCSDSALNPVPAVSGCSVHSFRTDGAADCAQCAAGHIPTRARDRCLLGADIQWGGSLSLLDSLSQ